MPGIRHRTSVTLAAACMLTVVAVGALAAETPRRGGILTFVVAGGAPSFDAHREWTFAMLQRIAPFYSVLIRINPDNASSTTDFVCDLCITVPKPMDGGTKYTFKIRRGVKFHDGSPLTAHDVVASYNKIIFPPKGVISSRKAHFSMVKKVYAPDDYTVVLELKYPSGAFIPALANPYNLIYSKKILDEDMHWYEKNVMGSGPFKFKQQKPGAFIDGVRNPDYYHKGKPYLDGFRALAIKDQSSRVDAIRTGKALIEFRGFPPRSRDLLKRALGDKITVQESDWNCYLLVVPNHKRKPFDDPRVRRALTLAIDRWGGAKYLAKVAVVKTVGGVVFPGHPLAATKEELEQIAGYSPNVERSRAEARRLLREAGVRPGFTFKLHNRGIDQPYKIIGAYLVNQWRIIGLNVSQWVQPKGAFFNTLRSGEFDVSIDYNCQAIVNPLLFVAKFISDDRTGNNNANYQDRELDKLFDAMNRSGDPQEQRRIMRKFEKRALDEQAHMFITGSWWYRIIPHRSIVRGWKISPSHYTNQDLGNVWLAEPDG
ncbi:MAG: ABC transporter substrate-binding protein [Proteobacteria bacterium]|nr:ABC transporter substrate-binding protein [Pseudomonadota bacterium]